MANWNPKIPLNFRTVVFCVLAGTVLSMPTGAILASRWLIFTPSPSVLAGYEMLFGVSLLLLPGWICVMMHCRWPTVAFVTVFFTLLLGLLFPAVD